MRLAREREELRIVADQIGAPTSARSIAQGVISIIIGNAPEERASDVNFIKRRFAEANGLVHMANSGQTSWHGLATAIVDGLRDRGKRLAVRSITAIGTRDFPTKAARPFNSRLDMTRLQQVHGIQMPAWREALDAELDAFVPGADRVV